MNDEMFLGREFKMTRVIYRRDRFLHGQFFRAAFFSPKIFYTAFGSSWSTVFPPFPRPRLVRCSVLVDSVSILKLSLTLCSQNICTSLSYASSIFKANDENATQLHTSHTSNGAKALTGLRIDESNIASVWIYAAETTDEQITIYAKWRCLSVYLSLFHFVLCVLHTESAYCKQWTKMCAFMYVRFGRMSVCLCALGVYSRVVACSLTPNNRLARLNHYIAMLGYNIFYIKSYTCLCLCRYIENLRIRSAASHHIAVPHCFLCDIVISVRFPFFFHVFGKSKPPE